MRVVSLLASATEVVCALEAGAMLVARSHECDNPAWVKCLPQCTQPAFDVTAASHAIDAEVRRRLRTGEPLYQVDLERIRALRPDLVITQMHCDVCAVTPGDVTGIQARQLSLSASTIEEIFAGIAQIAEAIGLAERGRTLVSRERGRIAELRRRTSHLPRPSVVLLEWADPLFTSGNWGPELVEIAGGTPLLAEAGEFSRAIPAERLREADPGVIVVAPCGFSLDRAMGELAVLERLPWWNDLRAVRAGKVAFADGNLYFNRSGMTIARSAGILAEIIHGLRFETAIDAWAGLYTAQAAR